MREIEYRRPIGVDRTLELLRCLGKVDKYQDINIYQTDVIFDLTDDEEQCILSNPCYRVGDLECFESCYWRRNNFKPPRHVESRVDPLDIFTINELREAIGRKPLGDEGAAFVPLPPLEKPRSVNQIRKTYGLEPIDYYMRGRTHDIHKVEWKQSRTYDYTQVDHSPEYTFGENMQAFSDHLRISLEPIGEAIIALGEVARRVTRAINAGIYCRLNGIYDYTMVDHAPEYEPDIHLIPFTDMLVEVPVGHQDDAKPTRCISPRCGCPAGDGLCLEVIDKKYHCKVVCPAGLKDAEEVDDQEPSGGALYEPNISVFGSGSGSGSANAEQHSFVYGGERWKITMGPYIPYEEKGDKDKYDYEGDDCNDKACGCDDWCMYGGLYDKQRAEQCKIRCRRRVECGDA
jgi:hypothetical protein